MFNKGQLAGLMEQAQAMQENLKKAQDELAFIEVSRGSRFRHGANLDDLQTPSQARHD
jgi:hypothetical protein